MENNFNTVVEEEANQNINIDVHCHTLLGVVRLYKNMIYILSFLGFFGFAIAFGEIFKEMGSGLNFFLSTLFSAIVTFFNILFVKGLYHFCHVVAEIARNTRK